MTNNNTGLLDLKQTLAFMLRSLSYQTHKSYDLDATRMWADSKMIDVNGRATYWMNVIVSEREPESTHEFFF